MRTEYVQVVDVESEDRRPVHAVLAVFDDDGEMVADARTVCRRLEGDAWRMVTTADGVAELVPFLNAPVADRCATCQALHLQIAAGLGGQVATFDAAEMHRPLDQLEPPGS